MIGGFLLLGLTIFLAFFFDYHLNVKKRTSTGMIEVNGFLGYLWSLVSYALVWLFLVGLFCTSVYLIYQGLLEYT
jgi:hypothetical protein